MTLDRGNFTASSRTADVGICTKGTAFVSILCRQDTEVIAVKKKRIEKIINYWSSRTRKSYSIHLMFAFCLSLKVKYCY